MILWLASKWIQSQYQLWHYSYNSWGCPGRCVTVANRAAIHPLYTQKLSRWSQVVDGRRWFLDYDTQVNYRDTRASEVTKSESLLDRVCGRVSAMACVKYEAYDYFTFQFSWWCNLRFLCGNVYSCGTKFGYDAHLPPESNVVATTDNNMNHPSPTHTVTRKVSF